MMRCTVCGETNQKLMDACAYTGTMGPRCNWVNDRPEFVGTSEQAAQKNKLADARGGERMPGIDPKTGEYSTTQMMHDEFFGGDTGQPLFD
jgi:hypothetical protein